MKKFIYSMAAIAAIFGLSACSSEEDVPAVPQGETADTYLQLTVGFPSTATRADDFTDNNETSGKYAIGIEREYQIHEVSLYFFRTQAEVGTDKETTVDAGTLAFKLDKVPVKMSDNLTTSTSNYENATLGQAYTTGTIQLKNSNLVMGNNYHVYALCNMNTSGSKLYDAANAELTPTVDVTKEADFTASTIKAKFVKKQLMPLLKDDANTTTGMPMASRGYYQNDDATNASTTYAVFSYGQLNNSTNPVKLKMYIERSYGRVTLLANADGNFEYTLKDANGNELGTVTLEGYKVINKTKAYNTFRTVGNAEGTKSADNAFGALSTTEASTKFLMTPTFVTFSAGYSANTANQHLQNSYNAGTTNLGGFTALNTTEALIADADGSSYTTKYAILDYPGENAMANEKQFQGYCTGVLFKAKINPDASAVKGTYTAGADLYAYDNQLYATLADLPIAVTKDNYYDYGVVRYVQGYCYYLYYIRHADNFNYPNMTPTDSKQGLMGDMEFAIVRSNSYDLAIESIVLTKHTNPYPGGDPTPDYDDPDTPNPNPNPNGGDDPYYPDPYDPNDPGFTPSDPAEIEFNYLNAKLVVRPWIVRKENVVFVE